MSLIFMDGRLTGQIFFDDGHEWYGACCWSIYDKSMYRYVVMLVSATD